MFILDNWYPAEIVNIADEPICRWLNLEAIEFDDPFFYETLLKGKVSPLNNPRNPSSSVLDVLPMWRSEFEETIAPSLFIFHISRCGSTLISQILGLSDENIVLAEPPFIDQLLRSFTLERWMADSALQEILKAAIAFYGRKRKEANQRLIIKTDSWHIRYLPLLRTLYPATPSVFLYRDPAEVIRSHQKKRGMHAAPGVIGYDVLGIEMPVFYSLDEHITMVLESYFNQFNNSINTEKPSLLVNYNQGMEQVIKQLFSFAGINITYNYNKNIQERLKYNAKYPDEIFTEAKITEAQPKYMANLYRLYHQLEDCRLKKALIK